ncbi:hypothetical protein SERLA73DRAFT_187145 [Serpula lacrymans var. lacrymans S7.3]|uniref:Uncharacterized protein n=2 Tax=Serpula lacrymans var. lacrymans TaxID=341189 RepID=F8Q8J8_SERL3|nr:uncharacterized protein SERLADRAFT_476549 [Serpula lacrymans var. lacrymans S7.9]EGN95886.1 hypothetical protein SERLA73DRAFT_187145 [Serpula lacrymans var. lacrymans S7.3]EGO21399.1 hypothetical protein SERLADRAFT_476549 [Serpula lacrymans var. lacrymans S7.9]
MILRLIALPANNMLPALESDRNRALDRACRPYVPFSGSLSSRMLERHNHVTRNLSSSHLLGSACYIWSRRSRTRNCKVSKFQWFFWVEILSQ